MGDSDLAAIQDAARVFTKQVLAKVVARTRGALPSESEVYHLAAPMGRVWTNTLNGHGTSTSKVGQMCHDWVNLLIFDKLIFTPFHILKMEINHIGFIAL